MVLFLEKTNQLAWQAPSWKTQQFIFIGLGIYSGHVLFFPAQRVSDRTTVLGAYEMPDPHPWTHTQHSIQSGHTCHNKGGTEVGPWPWDPLVMSYGTPSRSGWPHRVLECVSKGTAEILAQKYSQYGMASFRCNIQMKSKGLNHPQRKEYMGLGT